MWNATDFAWGEFTHAIHPGPSQTGRMTHEKLRLLIKAGYGQGHRQRYKPWLRVTKRDMSPVGFVGHLASPELGRLHHFRSWAERRTIQMARWLGAVDVREQYPMWPQTHPHPGTGLWEYKHRERVKGLIEIADEAQIPHGYFVGTNIPYVGTLDSLTTWKMANGETTLIALDNKPEEILQSPKQYWRARERLELARRYCIECNIKHLIIHAENFPEELSNNLDALSPVMTTKAMSKTIYKEIVERLSEYGYKQSPAEIILRIAKHRHSDPLDLHRYFHLALWRLDIDHDLAEPFDPAEPLQAGGIALRRQLRTRWLGADA